MANNVEKNGSDWGFQMLKAAVIFNGVAKSVEYVSKPISSLFSDTLVKSPAVVSEILSFDASPVVFNGASPLVVEQIAQPSNFSFSLPDWGSLLPNWMPTNSYVEEIPQRVLQTFDSTVISNVTNPVKIASEVLTIIPEPVMDTVSSSVDVSREIVSFSYPLFPTGTSTLGMLHPISNVTNVLPESIPSFLTTSTLETVSTPLANVSSVIIPEVSSAIAAPILTNVTLPTVTTKSLVPLMCAAKPLIPPAVLGVAGAVVVVAGAALAHRLYHKNRKNPAPIKTPISKQKHELKIKLKKE